MTLGDNDENSNNYAGAYSRTYSYDASRLFPSTAEIGVDVKSGFLLPKSGNLRIRLDLSHNLAPLGSPNSAQIGFEVKKKVKVDLYVFYSAVSSPLDRSYTFPPLAELFIPTPTRLLREAF